MNRFRQIIIILFTTPLFFVSVATQDGGSPGDQKEITRCNQHLMASYLLKGKEISDNSTLLFCPNVKNNCCNRLDQQRAYHFVKDIVEGKVIEYAQRITILLQQMGHIHQSLVESPPIFFGSDKRKTFCSRKYRDLLNFDLSTLLTDIKEVLSTSEQFVEDHYGKFFCMLCDGKAHAKIKFTDEEQTVALHLNYCREVLKDNKDMIQNLNVEMVNYMELVQHLVDCTHYQRSYNLKFPRQDKWLLKSQISKCYNTFNGPDFQENCNPVCKQFKFSEIMPMMFGDFQFLHEMVLIFNRFLKYKESGNIISMKLRNFFRTFRMNPILAKTDRTSFTKSLVKRPVKKSKGRKLKDSGTLNSKKHVKIENKRKEKTQVRQKKSRFLKVAMRGLRPHNSLHHHEKRLLAEIVPIKQNLKNGRLLAHEKKVVNIKRPGIDFDSQLTEFYEQIEVKKMDEQIPTIYTIRKNPVFFDKLEKIWGDVGINYEDYGVTRFNMPRRIFYNLLYKYRKPDLPDTSLTLFLMDFSEGFYKNAEDILKKNCEILATNFGVYEGEVKIGEDRRRKLINRPIEELLQLQKMKSAHKKFK